MKKLDTLKKEFTKTIIAKNIKILIIGTISGYYTRGCLHISSKSSIESLARKMLILNVTQPTSVTFAKNLLNLDFTRLMGIISDTPCFAYLN